MKMFSLIPRPLREHGWYYYCWRCGTDLGPPAGVEPSDYNHAELAAKIRAHVRAHKIQMRNQL